jgi:hypothetical protein
VNIADIKHGIQNRPPRIVLCGVEKIGKSTFASGAPNPVFLPIKGEEGIDALAVPRTPVIESYNGLMEAIGMLAEQKHDYETVVIDSISTLEPLVWEHLCKTAGVDSIEKVGGGFGKGYVEAVGLWREIMSGLDYLREEKGMGSILIGHVVVRTFTDPLAESYDAYEMDIHKKAAAAIFRWSDCILFANNKVAVREDDAGKKKGIQRADRVLFTQRRPAHMGGGRGIFGQLPYELDLTFDAFASAIEKASKQGE